MLWVAYDRFFPDILPREFVSLVLNSTHSSSSHGRRSHGLSRDTSFSGQHGSHGSHGSSGHKVGRIGVKGSRGLGSGGPGSGSLNDDMKHRHDVLKNNGERIRKYIYIYMYICILLLL